MPCTRKAQITIDMVVALMLFISMIFGAFYYMNYLANPKEPFDITLRERGFQLAGYVSENISWTVYHSPVWITSPNSSAWNFELFFYPDVAVDTNSIAILGQNMTEIPSAYSGNYTTWVSNLTAGKNLFYLIYTKNTTLQAAEYTTDLSASGLSANNSAINVTFSSTGISSIIFGGSEILASGISLDTSGIPQATTTKARAMFAYPDGVFAKVYSNLSKIAVSSNHSINPVIYLKPELTEYYDGSEHTFSSSGEQFNAILNLTDIYSASYGVSAIGRNINISVRNSTYREIRLFNVTDFEIYIHPGDYSRSLAEGNIYANIEQMLLGLPSGKSGISMDGLQSLSEMNYSEVRPAFGTSNFNLTVSDVNASVGRSIPLDRSVVAIQMPVAIMGRTGNITESRAIVAIWLGN